MLKIVLKNVSANGELNEMINEQPQNILLLNNKIQKESIEKITKENKELKENKLDNMRMN